MSHTIARENGKCVGFFFVSWKIATCQNIGVLLVRREGKVDFEYLSAVSATDLHNPSFLFVPVMQN